MTAVAVATRRMNDAEKARLLACCVDRFTQGMHHADCDLLADEVARVEAMEPSPLVKRMRNIVEAEQTVRRAQQLLIDLGDTADKVADRLRALGIRGAQDWSNACPLSVYLDRHGIDAFVSAEEITVPVGEARAFVTTPPAIAAFIRLFDAGVYLDLVDPELNLLDGRATRA